jgi:N-acetylmuramoyl-L-alanine amidase
MRIDTGRLVPLLLVAAMLGCGAPAQPAQVTAPPSATPAVATPVPSPTSPVGELTPTPAATPTPTATATPAPPTQPQQAVVPLNAQPVPRDSPRITALPRASGSAPMVVIDPGHGADEVGAAASGVVEKASNLEMAFRVEALLQAQGVRVLLTRRADERAYIGLQDGGFNSTRRDLQARVDLANDAAADLFVSIHSNGSNSGADNGIETYYNSQRPFASLNQTLAATLQAAVMGEVRAAGYSAYDRGYKDDACLRAFQGRCFPRSVLGPPRITTRDEVLRRGGDPSSFGFASGQDEVGSRATLMPGALVELLFVSNPSDNALLRTEDARAALARGVARGILEFLQAHPRTG